MNGSRVLSRMCVASVMLAGAVATWAQDYPVKPVRIITAAVGGGADVAARIVAQGISGPLGQQVITDNRGGSGGMVGGEMVAKAAPDGYTLLVYGNTIWLAPFMRERTPYDPVRDFAPVTLVVSSPSMVVVHPSLPVKTVRELIALAKSRPGKLNYGTSGAGSASHLAGELFKAMAGVDIVRVNYKGAAPAFTDVVAGNVQLTFGSATLATPHLGNGRLRALAVTGAQRSALFPNLPSPGLTREAKAMIAAADVVLSLDWIDLSGAFKQACGTQPVSAKVIQVSCDAHNHRGWSSDHQGLPPVDIYMMCETDAAVPLLLEACSPRAATAALPSRQPLPPQQDVVCMRGLADALQTATRGVDVCYTRFPLGWNGGYTHFRHPLDYIGHDGGAGVGSAPGMTVGAGLALKGSCRIPLAVLGDGDFLMGNTAIWTAAHYQIPCLFVVCNNRSFYNDEQHQERMAVHRGRPGENKWIGMHLAEPDIDIAAMARSQGALGIGPVAQPAELLPAIEQGVAAVRAGQVCVIDVRVIPGYDRAA